MVLIKVYKLSDIELYRDILDDDNTVDYHLDLVTYNQEDINYIVQRFTIIKEKASYAFHIIIEAENQNFTDLEIAFFMELEAKLKARGMIISFNGGYKKDYTLAELIQADKTLDHIINKINSFGFSPFEKYLYIYHYLANKKFKKEDIVGEENYKPRDVISVMTSDYIVCEGYARLMKYLCDNVGITCICQTLTVNKGLEKHMNNLVYLDDDKYDIHGLYYADVTWDNIGNHGDTHTLAFSLVTIDDVNKINCHLSIDPFYLLFHDPKKAAIRVIDSDELSFVGENISPTYYLKSLAEDLFDIEDEVKESYDRALDLYLKRRRKAIYTVKEMLLEHSVPNDAYERQFLTPFGSSLPFLVATLCYNEKGYNVVENGIKRLLKHVKSPLDGEDGPFEGEQMPYYRTPNPYLTLDALYRMSDEEINNPLEELQIRNNDLSKQEYQPAIDFDLWLANKKVYDNLMQILHKLRNMLLYKTVKDRIVTQFPHGEPIRLLSIFRGMSAVYEALGYEEKDALKITKKCFIDSTALAKKAFADGATNCFKNNDTSI